MEALVLAGLYMGNWEIAIAPAKAMDALPGRVYRIVENP
jgi:hypothetical protein